MAELSHAPRGRSFSRPTISESAAIYRIFNRARQVRKTLRSTLRFRLNLSHGLKRK